tara:strand:- start:2435 stop:4738 length:2304 start_codon:yes stop_codon:yes gene_type:complete
MAEVRNVITQPKVRGGRGSVIEKPSERLKNKTGTKVKETAYNDHRPGMGGTVGATSTNKPKPFSANPSRSTEDVKIRWLQNELTARQSFTYHLRLTMLSPKDNKKIGYTAAQTLNSENGMIVAETGVTSKFNITDLETNHIVNWTPKARAAYGLSATMTIVEPLGVTLLDNIVRGAKELGIKNHINAAYLLEISFKESDDDESNTTDDKGNDRLPYHFIYVMSITDFTIAVDQGGAKYYLKLVEIPQVALFSSVQTSKEATTIKANTLGQFTTEFTKILNERSKKEASTNSKFPDAYIIGFDEGSEKLSQWSFSAYSIDAPKYSLDVSGDGILNSTFPIGHGIVDILSVAIGATKEMQELPTASGSTAKASGEDNERKDSDLRLWFRIVPDVQISNTWDGNRNVYKKTFIYKIKLAINEKVADISNAFQADKNGQRTRLKALIEEKLLAKKYMYMYTGQNTEVLHFDIKFNHTYWVVKARYDGVHSNPDTILSQTPGAEKIKNQPSNSPPGTKMGSSVQEVAKSPPSAKPAITTVAGPMDYLRPPESGKFLSNPTAKDSPNQTRYLEAFSTNEESDQGDNWFAAMKKPAIVEKAGTGFVNVAGPGAYKFGAVYQDMNSSADLAEIELNIIGDPYWLGMSNINKQYANVGGVAAFYDQGSNLFYFKLLMPQEHDETGDTVISDSFTISGLYGVREVISSYRDGGFTQHLYAYRSEASNYNLLKDTLDATKEKTEKPSKTKFQPAEDQLNASTTPSSAPPPLDSGGGIQ